MAEGLVTHIERSDDVDPGRAQQQWRDYVQALHDAGWTTAQVDPAPDCPDSAFIEDTMVVAQDLAVIAAPGARERIAEIDAARQTAIAAGLRVVELADAPVARPATLDGGDVLTIGATVYVGLGGRTNEAGCRALAHHLEQVDRSVIPIPISRTLHLKSQVTALPDGTVVGYRPLVDDPDMWPKFLDVPEAEGAHVVVLGPDTVLMSDQAPRSAELFRGQGLYVITVAIDEFVKLEGCVTCLSVRLHDAD